MNVNRTHRSIIILLLTLALGAAPGENFTTNSAHSAARITRPAELHPQPNPEPPSEVLLKLGAPTKAGGVSSLITRHDLTIVKRIPRIDVWVVTRPQTPVAELARRLVQEKGVLWAEPNGRIYATGVITPNDTCYLPMQWNLRLVRLPEAWTITTGDETPIAVLDTGIDLDHADLAAKIWTNEGEIPGNGLDDDDNGYVDDVHGWNFVAGTALLAPEPHGTHVAGIAAAHTDNQIGIAGVNWQSTVMPLQVLQNGSGSLDDLAEAIIYAADNGAQVLNLSLGGEIEEDARKTVDAAIAHARSQGCLLVASAGNNRTQPYPVLYPANSPQVMAVTATTADDVPWSNSNRGPEVDVAAPGVGIYSLSTDDSYASMTGTSMAAPHVSGLAALIWSVRPALTADQVAHVITHTAQDTDTPGWDPRTGWGRIDALAAIQAASTHFIYIPIVQR